MPFPGVKVDIGNGNLLANINVPDAVPAIVGNGELKAVSVLYGADDFPAGGMEAGRQAVEEFYREVGGRTMLLYTEYGEQGELEQALERVWKYSGAVNLMAVVGYCSFGSPRFEGDEALAQDIIELVPVLKAKLEARQASGHPVRLFLPGYYTVLGEGIAYEAKSAGNGYVAIVLGNADGGKEPAVGVALGRATKVAAHVKIGDGTVGALSIGDVSFGMYGNTKSYDEVGEGEVEVWHDKGYLTFMRRAGLEGWYFGVDNMCSNDDFSTLAHGRVIDKAQRIAIAAYMPYVETPMQMADDGTIDIADAESMAKVIESQLRAQMSGQVSNVKVVVPTAQDLVNTHTLRVSVSVLPLGYNTWISVEMDLVSRL